MAPAQMLLAVAVALTAPARGQEIFFRTRDYENGDCTTGTLYRDRYQGTLQCEPTHSYLINCSSGAPFYHGCGAHEFSIERPTTCYEDDGHHVKHDCATLQAYGVLEQHVNASCDGVGASMAWPLGECILEKGNSVMLTTSGFFRYEGVTDCSGTGIEQGDAQWYAGTCMPTPEAAEGGYAAMRFRVVGFTLAQGLASGAAKAGCALGCALLVLLAVAANAE